MFALKFISGKYQGGEFPLKPNKQIIIGRSSELDMVLVEDMVSRKHAKISVGEAGKIVIEDLGSTNGTFVNGEKIKQARLKEGDRILIGTSILKLVTQQSGMMVDDQQAKKKLEQARELHEKSNRSSSMTGKIEEVPLPDLLQLFATSKKNGVLRIRDGEREGRVYLKQGKVTYAVIDDHHASGPRKSFFRIVRWEHGDFELLPPDNTRFQTELDESTEALLMEGLRQFDEMRRFEAELPPPTATLIIAMPLEPKLRDLDADSLDLLQLVHNCGAMQIVLDRASTTDLDTCAALLDLLKRGYVQAS